MKIMIAFSSKTGSTKKAAGQLAELLTKQGAVTELFDLSIAMPHISSYDAIAVGGPIRMGQLHKCTAKFVSANSSELLKKPLGIFCCRCGKDDLRNVLTPKLGKEILSHAVQVASFGSEMELSKQKGFDRLIVKMITQKDNSTIQSEGIVGERICIFATALLEAVKGE